MTNAETIKAKTAQLNSLVQLSPEWETLWAEIVTIRRAMPNPIPSAKPGTIAYSGKGRSRRPFMVASGPDAGN